MPGVNVSAVARRHGLKPQQVFAWRRQALRSSLINPLRPEGDRPAFLHVAIERSGLVELLIGNLTIRAGADVPAFWLAVVVRVVRTA